MQKLLHVEFKSLYIEQVPFLFAAARSPVSSNIFIVYKVGSFSLLFKKSRKKITM